VAVTVFLLTLAVLGVLGSRQVVAGTYLLYFPNYSSGDVWKLTDSYFCKVGDSVIGTREVDIAQFNKIRSIDIYLNLSDNSGVSNVYPLWFEVSFGGSLVGNFPIYGGDGLNPTKTINLASEFILTKSSLDINYTLTNSPGGGIIIRPEGSTLRLNDGLAPKTKRDFTLEALAGLEDLRDNVYNSGIDQGSKNSLLSKLDHAIAKVDKALVYIDKGNEQKANKNLYIAKNSVVSFVKAVDIFSERIVAYHQAWHDEANVIMELIEEAIEAPL